MAEETKEQPRLQHLKSIESSVQERMANEKLYEFEALEGHENMEFEEKNATKYLATFPYPYMNGYLHLGHAYSMSKSEFMTRYQRQLGKRALFPFGFHCTGMPISSAAIRLQREIANNATCSNQPSKAEIEKLKKQNKDYKPPSLTQYEILAQLEIPETEIPRFTDPNYWLEFFPPLGKEDLQRFGVHTDWRRSMITTDKNPYYDKFIRWQFHHLKANNKIKFGKRYTIFSESERQPCADHDRGSGEGVGPQEYCGIKIRLLEMPDKMAQFSDRNVFLVAGTLRPETMYGQTNCFVLPEGDYGVFEMKNDDLFVISERAARHFAHQEMTKVDYEYPSLVNLKGQELIGKKVKAPMTSYDFVYVLPLPTISMTKGTAVVTSVPSDAPNDYAMLIDLQNKEGLRQKMGVELEWVQGFDPIPLIDVPGMGDLCAKVAVEELKIQSHKDVAKLEQAKDRCYNEGFYKGVMKIGIAAGKKVEDAKPIIKKQMYDEGNAVPYYEPEKEVTARTGEPCIVALCDQWLLEYGEDQWKEQVRSHIQSDKFYTYNPQTQHEFELIIDWLKEWGCSRTTGLGTRVPWDEQFVIESLSDSTIYQAFYTISHMLQGGDMEGSQVGPSGIPASALSVEAFDYIFLGQPFNAEKCPGLTEEQLRPLRQSFEYWYPMDLGVSGKDLIRNHLTMALYNNQAVWQDNEKRNTRSYFCNGHLQLNGDKMSKSTGNFLTINQCIERFGSEASRIALADAGDTLDDANFDVEVANRAILKLFNFEQWVDSNLSKQPLNYSQDDASSHRLWDKLMINEINQCINQAKADYDEMKYRQIIVLFNHMLSIKESYKIAVGGQTNPYVIAKFVETFLTIMNPITPHFCQHVWQTKVYPVLHQQNQVNEILMNNGWPQGGPTDRALTAQLKFLESTKREICLAVDKAKSGGKRKGKNAGGAAAEVTLDSCVVAVGKTFPEYKLQILEILNAQQWDERGSIQGKDYIAAISKAFPDKKKKQLAQGYAAFVIKEASEVGKEQALVTSSPFDEVELINMNKNFLFESVSTVTNIEVLLKEDDKLDSIPNGKSIAEAAAPGKPAMIFYSSTGAPAATPQANPAGKKGQAPKGGNPKGGKGGKQQQAQGGGGANNAMASEIESKLGDNLWLGGQQPSKDDAEKFTAMGGNAPNVETHPEAYAWYTLVGRFSEEVRSSWTAAAPAQQPAGKKGGKGAQQAAGGKKGGKKEPAKAPAAAAQQEQEDNFDDLFDADPAADAAAAEALKKKNEEAKKGKKKAAPVAKSLIIWEVKPWGEDTDLDALANKILGIEMDGLFWKTEWKKEPVAYGIYKIVIGATVEDEKVSTDLVQEKIEAFEDDVQSVDIVAFNKL